MAALVCRQIGAWPALPPAPGPSAVRFVRHARRSQALKGARPIQQAAGVFSFTIGRFDPAFRRPGPRRLHRWQRHGDALESCSEVRWRAKSVMRAVTAPERLLFWPPGDLPQRRAGWPAAGQFQSRCRLRPAPPAREGRDVSRASSEGRGDARYRASSASASSFTSSRCSDWVSGSVPMTPAATFKFNSLPSASRTSLSTFATAASSWIRLLQCLAEDPSQLIGQTWERAIGVLFLE